MPKYTTSKNTNAFAWIHLPRAKQGEEVRRMEINAENIARIVEEIDSPPRLLEALAIMSMVSRLSKSELSKASARRIMERISNKFIGINFELSFNFEQGVEKLDI